MYEQYSGSQDKKISVALKKTKWAVMLKNSRTELGHGIYKL